MPKLSQTVLVRNIARLSERGVCVIHTMHHGADKSGTTDGEEHPKTDHEDLVTHGKGSHRCSISG